MGAEERVSRETARDRLTRWNPPLDETAKEPVAEEQEDRAGGRRRGNSHSPRTGRYPGLKFPGNFANVDSMSTSTCIFAALQTSAGGRISGAQRGSRSRQDIRT